MGAQDQPTDTATACGTSWTRTTLTGFSVRRIYHICQSSKKVVRQAPRVFRHKSAQFSRLLKYPSDTAITFYIIRQGTIHPKYVFPTALALFFITSKNPICHLTLQRYSGYCAAYLRSWKKFCFFAKKKKNATQQKPTYPLDHHRPMLAEPL